VLVSRFCASTRTNRHPQLEARFSLLLCYFFSCEHNYLGGTSARLHRRLCYAKSSTSARLLEALPVVHEHLQHMLSTRICLPERMTCILVSRIDLVGCDFF